MFSENISLSYLVLTTLAIFFKHKPLNFVRIECSDPHGWLSWVWEPDQSMVWINRFIQLLDSAYQFIMIWFLSYSLLEGKVIREKGFITRHLALRSYDLLLSLLCETYSHILYNQQNLTFSVNSALKMFGYKTWPTNW